jgi:prophage antirepressor-like protein
MNELQIFKNPEFGEVRSFIINNEVWFVGIDVAGALGYAKPHGALTRHVDTEDSLKRGVLDGRGIEQQTTLINETGVVSLALMSELPSAKKFRRWISKDVIPSILKTGSFNHPALSSSQMFLEQAKINIEIENRVSVIETKLDNALTIFATSTPENWRGSMERQMKELCGGSPKLRSMIYDDVDDIARVSLNNRLIRLRKRIRKKCGATYQEANKLTKLDVISHDKQLKAIFESVLKRHQAIKAAKGEQTDYLVLNATAIEEVPDFEGVGQHV